MRIIFLVIFAVLLAAPPLYALNSLIMPQLQTTKQFYAHEGAIADNVAQLQQ